MADILPLHLDALPADDRPARVSALEPLLVSANDLAKLLRLSVRTIRALDASGKLPRPLRISPGCVRWKFDEIRSWVAAGAPDRAMWERIRARK